MRASTAWSWILNEIGWGLEIGGERARVTAYQKNRASGTFDNYIRLYPNVGDYLVMLNGLLRPLIHRGWSAVVARLNGLDESRLESFLFGMDRKQLAVVRPGLTELQGGRCFYCDAPLGRAAEVDHFIPWARYPDNGIDNLVVADIRCNGARGRDHWRPLEAGGTPLDLESVVVPSVVPEHRVSLF